ncbi:MAG TPA: IPT/TIG domain-containing protein, partial [Solirubrobacteraceae bacterium]|nr:IPT/TIG domain-containing protein [Solirubrobacteraceae bacterium]
PILGASSTTYATGPTTSAQSGTKFKATFTNEHGETDSSEVTLSVNPAPPAITKLEPKQGSTAGGTEVTIKGSGFGASTATNTVTIGGAKATVTAASATSLTVTTPAGSAGPASVVVSNTSDGLSVTDAGAYTYLPPAPGTGGAAGKPAAKSGVLASSETVPPPKFVLTGNVAPVSGVVLVKLPGSSTFVPLTELRQIPFGTIVDATNGRVTVTTEGPHGVLQTITYYEGEFRLTQGRDGLVVATLVGGDFSVCPTARERSHLARTSSRHASSKHTVRKLWSEGHGRYSTKGNYAAGAVLGTKWLTEDRCDGTLIHVFTDRVAITNFVNHRHLIVTAGHSYLAKAP